MQTFDWLLVDIKEEKSRVYIFLLFYILQSNITFIIFLQK